MNVNRLAEAAARKRRADALREFLDAWEAENGALTPEELARAEVELGFRKGDPTAQASPMHGAGAAGAVTHPLAYRSSALSSTSAGTPERTARPASSTIARSATRRTSSATCDT